MKTRDREQEEWYLVDNGGEVPSPALLIYEERVRENIRLAVETAGGPDRLRPHVKTHKSPEVLRLQMEAGISKFKCATIAEAEMAAAGGAGEVLLAAQPVGPNVGRLVELRARFLGTQFATIADDEGAIRELAAAFAGAGNEAEVLLDIDCGMHRSGIAPSSRCLELYGLLEKLPGVRAGGLHVYDGHVRVPGAAARGEAYEEVMAPVAELKRELEAAGLAVPRLVGGGSPPFPLHAARAREWDNYECSPGTFVFWDAGYAETFPDLAFRPAALVLTRIISRPGPGRWCFDLGHKAIASENPIDRRVRLIGWPGMRFTAHSEEHLVGESDEPPAPAEGMGVGDCRYGIPWHICPTVALYGEARVVRDGLAAERWGIAARERRLTI